VALKVRLAGNTVPSFVLLLETAMVTSDVGAVFRTTTKVAMPPSSVVFALGVLTLMPGRLLGGVDVVGSRKSYP
jgi:hypothetical protein